MELNIHGYIKFHIYFLLIFIMRVFFQRAMDNKM